MNIRNYLKGIGVGIIVASLVLIIAGKFNNKAMSDEDVIKRAKELGMVESTTLTQPSANNGLANASDTQVVSDDKNSNQDSANISTDDKNSDGTDASNSDADSSTGDKTANTSDNDSKSNTDSKTADDKTVNVSDTDSKSNSDSKKNLPIQLQTMRIRILPITTVQMPTIKHQMLQTKQLKVRIP